MYKLLTKRINAGFAIIFLLIFGNSILLGQKGTDIQFNAYAGYKTQGLEMQWSFLDPNYVPNEVEVWMQKGIFYSVSDMDNAEKIATLTDNDWMGERGIYFAYLEMEFDKGYYTFYISVTNPDGTTLISNTSQVSFYNWQDMRYLEFTSTPIEKAKIGEEYQYTVVAIDKENEDAEIIYSLFQAPQGMSIDENTGAISWTPETKGFYDIWVHAEVKDSSDVFGEQFFNINVFSCQKPAVVFGEIKDSKGNLVKDGFIQLFDKSVLDSMNEEFNNSYYSGVINGKYSLEVDEGEYFVVYQDKYGYYEFYENAFDWETATTIPANCEDKIELNMNLSEEMSTEFYTVSGNVSYEDNSPAQYMQVFFEGTGSMGGREKMIMMSTMTDESGNYSMELPNGYTYFAYIEGEWDPVTGIQRVLYYNQTYNRKDAEKMILESDLSGINFIIKKGGNYTFYSVTGNVSMADGQPVMGAMVSFEGFYDVDYGRGNYFFNSVSTDSSGNYSIELPDIIEYRAYVTSPYVKLYRPLYYNQTYNPEEAEVLKLTGDLSGINFVIEEPDFKMFKVSGRVTNSDGEGISGAMVNFDGFNDAPDYYYNRWSESVSTNEDGYYEVVLPEIFKYIASAYQPFGGDRWKCIQPLFFNQTYNPEQATIIELTADRNDINFQFDAQEGEFKNSISGTVVNPQDELIQNVFVMAYLIGSQDDEFYFDGRASMANSNGEFKFVSMNPGKYVFLAVPKELSYLPGFYKENDYATMNWDEATIVELSDESEIADIKIKLSAMEFGEKGADGGIIQANGRVNAIKGQNSQERNAVSGAIVYLESTEGKVQQYSTSNNDGSFNLKNLPSGDFTLRVEKIGYKPYSNGVTFSGNSYYDLGEILLTPEVLSKNDDKTYNMINVKVTPNPVVDNATISFEGVAGQAVIKLINAKGQQLITNEINTINGSNNHTLSLSQLANGAYFVIVDNGGKSFAYPIVIKR